MTQFNGLELIKDNVKVAWVYIGEGTHGDYNEHDKDDIELLRFDISYKNEEINEWEDVSDASYCTNFPLNASDELKQKGLEFIMNLVYDKLQSGYSIKKLCEQLSYIDENCRIPSFK